MKRLALALLLGCFVMGCAGAATQSGSGSDSGSSVETVKKIPHGFDDVWPAVLETINDQAWGIASATRDAGSISTEYVQIGFDEVNEYSRCEMGFDTQIMRGRMRVEVTVGRQSLYESTMAVAVSIHGWDEGAKKAWVNCSSTGKVEDLIFDGVNRRLSIR